MLRTLWVVVSTLCVANVIALGIFLAWLGASDRLSAERLEEARLMFVRTVGEEEASEEEARRAGARAAREAEEAAAAGTAPITAEQRMSIVQEYAELVNQRTARARREAQDMIDTLMREQARFLEEREAFEAERASFEAMREEIAELEGSEQFKRALALYEKLRAEAAADMLSTLIEGGEVEQVVSYLNAMKTRTASKIVGEFESRDPALAADLLERLRTHGLVAQASEGG